MKRKVFITRKIQDAALAELNSKYQVDVHSGERPATREELQSGTRDADGLICFPYDRIDQKIIDSARNLRVISTYSVGFEHIDVGHARNRGIRIGYTPNVLTDATADMTFALLLDLFRRVSAGDRVMREDRWVSVYAPTEYLGTDPQGKTLGILGMGRIGRAVAKRADAFGMKTVYHNRQRMQDPQERSLGIEYVSFDELVTRSDVISIHTPHTAETEHLFDADVFARMKRTAYLINTARGRIVNERDLAAALRDGIIAGAGLDVFETEPINGENPLLKLQNVVLSPHMGSATTETRARMVEIVIRNLDLGMDGRKPAYSVEY